jgi:putative transcriptional regulator
MRNVLALMLVLLFGAATGGQGAAPPTAGDEAAAAPHVDGLAGQLLVAEPELGDPNFAGTVVLMVQHDPSGALGLVINRPYGKAPTAKLLRSMGLDANGVAGDTLLFYGGPVGPEIGMVVHSTDYALPDTRRVTPELAVTSNPAVLKDIAAGHGPKRSIPVLGYAGWGPGQLESELAQGSWFAIPADPELIFSPEVQKIWQSAIERKGQEL